MTLELSYQEKATVMAQFGSVLSEHKEQRTTFDFPGKAYWVPGGIPIEAIMDFK